MPPAKAWDPLLYPRHTDGFLLAVSRAKAAPRCGKFSGNPFDNFLMHGTYLGTLGPGCFARQTIMFSLVATYSLRCVEGCTHQPGLPRFQHASGSISCNGLMLDAWGRFWLEGRQVRSNFGTTKYCATYLRNSPCQNPDCLYLHELGDEEDRFTKEEIQQRSLLAPPIPSGAVTVTGGGGPSGTGKRCTSPVLPPPVYESPDSASGTFGGGAASRVAGSQQQGTNASSVVPASQRGGAGRGAKPTIQQVRRDERDRQQQQTQRQRDFDAQVRVGWDVKLLVAS